MRSAGKRFMIADLYQRELGTAIHDDAITRRTGKTESLQGGLRRAAFSLKAGGMVRPGPLGLENCYEAGEPLRDRRDGLTG
jgi:hypothetical protein